MQVKYRNGVCILFSLVVLFSLQIVAVAAINKGPYLCGVTSTSIVISWETTESSDSVVEYATDAQYIASGGVYDERVEDMTPVELHSITLTGLVPSTWYHYRIVSDADLGEDNMFHTAVGWGEPFTVAVYGDTRTNANDHLAVVNRIIQHEPDIVLNSGDLVDNGLVLPQWDIFFNTTRNLMKRVPYYPVLGNHERNAQNYYDLFHPPVGGGKENKQWYSFDYGNTHFVCLDSNARYSGEQLAWLEHDLAQAADTAQWIFAVFHHPPYSSGNHGSEFNTMTPWIDIFETYGVDIVFNGHDHIYERSLHNGIWYIVTGGGGAPRYAVNVKPNPFQIYAESVLHFCKLRFDGTQLTFEMVRADGTVGDIMSVTAPVEVVSASKLPSIWGRLKVNRF
ncbi:MAG: metallophosphoesterase [Candidatus Poribacteria bacterium]